MPVGRRIQCLLLALALALGLLTPALARQGTQKTVRVGWHEPPYFVTDENGRRSGYTYEYQWKVSAYTGWTWEYVQGSWSELLQMLKDGEIDVLGNVSWTQERSGQMLFTSLPMGTESYYILAAPDGISAGDYAALNGKRVGVTRGSIQKDFFLQWAAQHNVEPELVELTGTGEESVRLLGTELDAFVTLDVYADPETAVPVSKVGSSDFYFAVNRDRPDLLSELDAAMNRIQDENRFYNQQLYEKYLRNTQIDRYLTGSELSWLADHGTIRVGYQDNYLAFCARDPETGELTGALKDVLAYARHALENTELEFEAVSYPTAAEAVEALRRGEVDCVFPANLTDYDSEMLDLVMSPPLMRTEMDAVVRSAEQKAFLRKEQVTVAVNEGNTNYDLFLAEHYPAWSRAYYPDTPAGLEAVAAGEADCVIISNYRYGNISKQCERLRLSSVYTGVDMDYCFAMPKGETELYSILARVIVAVPSAAIHTALTYYSTEDVKTTAADVIRENLVLLTGGLAAVLLVILVLVLHSIRAERRVRAEATLINDLSHRVYVDALTSVRNKRAFGDQLQKLQDRIDRGERFSFAIAVCDCDNLKHINDNFGHDKGDIYLKTASALICQVFQHSPVFRIGGDEFAVVMERSDFEAREALMLKFAHRQQEVCAAAQEQWREVHIAMGVAVYDPEVDHSVGDTAHRADELMYRNKHQRKAARQNA